MSESKIASRISVKFKGSETRQTSAEKNETVKNSLSFSPAKERQSEVQNHRSLESQLKLKEKELRSLKEQLKNEMLSSKLLWQENAELNDQLRSTNVQRDKSKSLSMATASSLAVGIPPKEFSFLKGEIKEPHGSERKSSGSQSRGESESFVQLFERDSDASQVKSRFFEPLDEKAAGELRQMRETNGELQRKIEEMSKALLANEEMLANLGHQRDSYASMLVSYQKEISKLETELKQSKEVTLRQKEALETLAKSAEDHVSEFNRKAQKAIQTLEENLGKAKEKIKSQEGEIKGLEAEIKALHQMKSDQMAHEDRERESNWGNIQNGNEGAKAWDSKYENNQAKHQEKSSRVQNPKKNEDRNNSDGWMVSNSNWDDDHPTSLSRVPSEIRENNLAFLELVQENKELKQSLQRKNSCIRGLRLLKEPFPSPKEDTKFNTERAAYVARILELKLSITDLDATIEDLCAENIKIMQLLETERKTKSKNNEQSKKEAKRPENDVEKNELQIKLARQHQLSEALKMELEHFKSLSQFHSKDFPELINDIKGIRESLSKSLSISTVPLPIEELFKSELKAM